MKKYAGYIAAIIICVVLFAFFFFALVGYRFLGLCFLALGGVIGLYMALRALGDKNERAAKILRRCLTGLIVLGLLAVVFTEAFVVREVILAHSDRDTPQYAIVLGAGVHGTTPSRSLRVRLEAALDFARESPSSFLVLSGGRGTGEDITEARCMADYLIERGVSADRLILEERATSTEENLSFSRALIEERSPGCVDVCVITADYHIARAKLMARDAGFENVTARGADTGMPVLEMNYYLREATAIWWYLLTR